MNRAIEKSAMRQWLMAVAMMNRPFRRAWNYAMDFNLKCEKLKNFLSIMLRIMGECNKESLRRQMEICSRLILYFISFFFQNEKCYIFCRFYFYIAYTFLKISWFQSTHKYPTNIKRWMSNLKKPMKCGNINDYWIIYFILNACHYTK